MKAAPSLSRRDLAALELLEGLSGPALEGVLQMARSRVLSRDMCIFNQGDRPVRAHALIEGAVRIVQAGSDGAQIVVRFIGPGEMFGTMALFTDQTYPADAETLTDAIEVSWSEADLLELMNRHPQIAINALKIVGKRIQEVQYRLRELSTQPVERRVAHALLRLVQQVGRRTPEGMMIGFPLRRKDIADVSGTTLYSASRILTAWEKAGLLMTHNQLLTLRQPAEIQRIAESATD